MKYETKYQLIEEFKDSVNDRGHVYCTFDTTEKALKFANSDWFKKKRNIISDLVWERRNDGGRFESPALIQINGRGNIYKHTYVICIVMHNPQVEDTK